MFVSVYRDGLSTRQGSGSDEIQLRIDPMHADLDDEITGLRKQVRQLRSVCTFVYLCNLGIPTLRRFFFFFYKKSFKCKLSHMWAVDGMLEFFAWLFAEHVGFFSLNCFC